MGSSRIVPDDVSSLGRIEFANGAGAGHRTYWERVATSRWGEYISAAEEAAIRAAADLAVGPRDALDVGCDGGRWTSLLLGMGWAVTATDVDPERLEMCQERVPDARCVLVSAGARELPFDSDSVSLLICIEVHDVVHSAWFPEEASRVLRPGGLLVVVAWNKSSLRGVAVTAMARLRRRADRFYREAYARWRRRMTSSGFRVIGERGLCWFPFTRSSNSNLIPIATALEKKIGLSAVPRFSPWVLVIAQR